MATDCLSTDDFGADQQQVLDAFADLIELAHTMAGANVDGSIPRRTLEAAHEAYDTLSGILADEMVGGRTIENLPALSPLRMLDHD